MSDLQSFRDIEQTIGEELVAQKNIKTSWDRSKLPRITLKMPQPKISLFSKQRIHSTLHDAFQIPFLGYWAALIVEIIKLPRSQSKFRNELFQIQNELDQIEIKILKAHLDASGDIDKQLNQIREQLAQK